MLQNMPTQMALSNEFIISHDSASAVNSSGQSSYVIS
jgi:hypothetical protein